MPRRPPTQPSQRGGLAGAVGPIDPKKAWAAFNTIVITLGVLGLAWVGTNTEEGKYFRELWEYAKTAGPFGTLFAVLAWLSERRERREAQRQCADRTVDFIESVNMGTAAFDKMASGLTANSGRKGGRR